ncbi:MAG: MBL fold metallo-hydrolase [Candidatus ainarchaeum sp.]|jgi:L-ascorbate metabolism protein UlaG (beta-lactamase superfamily)|nr:MBL fold metallo-hydrolase [Candidatus ainarchaeum sp.]
MSISIKYLGHSSFLLTIDKKNILTDPFFKNDSLGKMERLVPCHHKVEDLPKIDTILISHEHTDSFDKDSVNYLSKKYNPKIISHYSILKDIEGLEHNKVSIEEYQAKDINNINIQALPAHHPGAFYPLSFLIKNKKGKTVYFAGDTYMTKDHDTIKPDIALLPIGGKRTMDLGTAIRVMKKMRPKFVIPMHYDTFEDIKRNPQELIYRFGKNYTDVNTVILNPGKTFKFKN